MTARLVLLLSLVASCASAALALPSTGGPRLEGRLDDLLDAVRTAHPDAANSHDDTPPAPR